MCSFVCVWGGGGWLARECLTQVLAVQGKETPLLALAEVSPDH